MSGVTVIKGPMILPMDGRDTVIQRGDLWLRDGRIVAILRPGDPPPALAEAVETIEASGRIVMPGLINGHSHSSTGLQRGTIFGAPLDLYVIRAMARTVRRTPRQVYVSAMLEAMELLRTGTTAVIDHLRYTALPSNDAIDAALSAYRDVGIRAVVAPMFEDKPYIDSLPIDPEDLPADIRARWRASTPPDPEAYFDVMASALSRWRGAAGRLDLMLGVDGPQRCSDRLLDLTGQFAERHAVGLHTHVLEAKTQALVAADRYGGSLVRQLDRFGLVGPRSSLVHFVWCTDDDIALAAERDVNIVHNPISNLQLGSGLQPTSRLLAAGLNVGLGTDGSSGAAMSLFEQAKFASLLSRISELDDARWIGAAQALRMATANGARLIGQAGQLGVIAPGARADLTIIDARRPLHQPFGDPWNHLLAYETGANVETVLVAGEVVLRDGRPTKVDQDAILAEAADLAAADLEANQAGLAVVERERPEFHRLLLAALRRSSPVERHAVLR